MLWAFEDLNFDVLMFWNISHVWLL